MKNIELKEAAKKLQENYRKKIHKYFKSMIMELDYNPNFHNDKEARVALLSMLEKCLLVSGKTPIINSIDIFEFIAPFHFEKFTEDRVIQLMRIRVPTLDYIFKDLIFLRKEFSNIKFNDNKLSVRTNDVILHNINFGPFDILFNLNNNIPRHHDDVDVRVKAIKPNYPSGGYKDYPHPHVECSHLCVGYGRRILSPALKELRLLDYFQIVNVILNTYGENPYESISLWSSERCNDCEKYEHPDDISYCNRCTKTFCDECVSTCDECDRYNCAFCMKDVCKDCGCDICLTCQVNCDACDEPCCLECITESCCGKVHKENCSECCDKCDTVICNKCVTICSGCESTCCNKCLKECENCNKTV